VSNSKNWLSPLFSTSHRLIHFGLSAFLGASLAISLTSHFFIDYLQGWSYCLVVLVLLGGLGFSLAYLLLERWLPCFTVLPLGVHAIFLILSLVLATLFAVARSDKSASVVWLKAVGNFVGQQVAASDRQAWGKQYSGFEIHATMNKDPQWMWRATAELPRSVQILGGTVTLLITQPEWTVFDKDGVLYQGGDGVEVRFLLDRGAGTEIIHQADLNLHSRPEQRLWETVKLRVPAGSKSLVLEALPGPPGSNNWNDRVFISVWQVDNSLETISRPAEWNLVLLLVYLSLTAATSVTCGKRENFLAQPADTSEVRFKVSPRGAMLDVLFISFVVLMSAIIYIQSLGFYSDDWAFLGVFATSSDKSFFGSFHSLYDDWSRMRPFQVLYLTADYWLFDLHPLGYHAVNHTFLLLGVVLFYLVLREFGQTRTVALSVATVYALLPHYSTDRFWFAAHPVTFSMALYFLSLYSDFRAVRSHGNLVWTWKAASILSMLASTLTYEVFIPLFAFNLLLVWIHARKLDSPVVTKLSNHSLVLLCGSSALIVTTVAIFKQMTTVRLQVQTSILDHILSVAVRAVSWNDQEYLHGFNFKEALRVNYDAYGINLPLTAIKLLRVHTPDWTVWALSTLLALMIFTYLNYCERQLEAPLFTNGRMIRTIGFGLLVFVLGYGVFFVSTDIQITAAGIGNRVSIAAAIGVAIFLVGFIGVVCLIAPVPIWRRRLFCGLVTLLCAASFLVIQTLASFWVESYRKQKEVLADIRRQFPGLSATTLVLDGVCPYAGPAIVFESDWDLAGALKVLYQDSTLQAFVVTSNLRIKEDGLYPSIYGMETRYPYHNMLIYNLKQKITYAVSTAGRARSYFKSLNPDFSGGCPRGIEGVGVPVF
jgi:hypothetical protein